MKYGFKELPPREKGKKPHSTKRQMMLLNFLSAFLLVRVINFFEKLNQKLSLIKEIYVAAKKHCIYLLPFSWKIYII